MTAHCRPLAPGGPAAGGAASAASGIATSMISPMIDDTGPITGVMPVGNCSRTSASRSATSWRLR
jgi:hypothetical protein